MSEHGSDGMDWIVKWIVVLLVAAWAVNLAYEVLLKGWPVVLLVVALWLIGSWLIGRHNSGGFH